MLISSQLFLASNRVIRYNRLPFRPELAMGGTLFPILLVQIVLFANELLINNASPVGVRFYLRLADDNHLLTYLDIA